MNAGCLIQDCDIVTGICTIIGTSDASFRLQSGADRVFKSNHGEVVVAALVLVAVLIILVKYGPQLQRILVEVNDKHATETTTPLSSVPVVRWTGPRIVTASQVNSATATNDIAVISPPFLDGQHADDA
jgi:hypothetical protein